MEFHITERKKKVDEVVNFNIYMCYTCFILISVTTDIPLETL